MNLVLTRNRIFPRKALIGKLQGFSENGKELFTCHTLEDPLIYSPFDGFEPGTSRTKIPGITAIPDGFYRVELRKSPRFGIVTPILIDVRGFEFILIHPGNFVTDTEGCILVGDWLGGNRIVNSRKRFRELMALLRVDKGEITIRVH